MAHKKEEGEGPRQEEEESEIHQCLPPLWLSAISVRVTIAVMRHYGQKPLGEERNLGAYIS